MNFVLLFQLIASLAILILVILFPFRKKAFQKKLGKKLFAIKNRTHKIFIIGIILLSPFLIFIQFFREFQLYIHVVLSLTSVLAIEIALRDMLISKNNGVFENALLVDSRCIWKKDFCALPTLSYENFDEMDTEESLNIDAKEVAMKTLKIVTHSSGEIFISFYDKDERAEVVSIIQNWI